jgi:LysM repeat protein
MKVWVPSKKGAPESAPASATTPVAQQKPAATVASTGSKSARSHVVKENESIASIAKKYGVSESALLRENKLAEDDAIYVDDSLKIPTAGGTVAASSPPASQVNLTASPPKPRLQAETPPPQPKPAAATTASDVVGKDGAIRSYIVSAGEDENTICDAFGISKKVLFEYNHLSSTTKLKPGDEIAIPRVSKARKN